MFYYFMVIGNNIYDCYRVSLFVCYFFVVEVCDILVRNGNFLLEFEELLLVCFEDEYWMICILF